MTCDRSIISFNVDTRELLNVDKENVNNVYAFSELIRADYNATIDGSTDPVRRRAGSTRGTSELGRRLNFRCLPRGAGVPPGRAGSEYVIVLAAIGLACLVSVSRAHHDSNQRRGGSAVSQPHRAVAGRGKHSYPTDKISRPLRALCDHSVHWSARTA